MRIGKHSVVSIDYTLTGADGEVLDSSKGREPLIYIQGTGSIVVGLEEALDGKEKGASVKVSVPPAKGYGERQEGMVQRVPKKYFQQSAKLKPGMTTVLGLKEGGVDWALDDDNAKLVTAEMKKRVDAAKADIISGKITVVDYMSNNTCK